MSANDDTRSDVVGQLQVGASECFPGSKPMEQALSHAYVLSVDTVGDTYEIDARGNLFVSYTDAHTRRLEQLHLPAGVWTYVHGSYPTSDE